MHEMVGTKPDLAHAVNMVSKWIFRYFRGFMDYEIMFARKKKKVLFPLWVI
jgi:hypothetical protein